MICPRCWEGKISHAEGTSVDFAHKCAACGFVWETAFDERPGSPAPQITLRDFFAGCALVAGIVSEGVSPEGEAKTAYRYADAMMKARGE